MNSINENYMEELYKIQRLKKTLLLVENLPSSIDISEKENLQKDDLIKDIFRIKYKLNINTYDILTHKHYNESLNFLNNNIDIIYINEILTKSSNVIIKIIIIHIKNLIEFIKSSISSYVEVIKLLYKYQNNFSILSDDDINKIMDYLPNKTEIFKMYMKDIYLSKIKEYCKNIYFQDGKKLINQLIIYIEYTKNTYIEVLSLTENLYNKLFLLENKKKFAIDIDIDNILYYIPKNYINEINTLYIIFNSYIKEYNKLYIYNIKNSIEILKKIIIFRINIIIYSRTVKYYY